MKPDYYAVHPALQPWVSHIMVLQVRLSGAAYSRQAPFPPTPQHSLNFYPGDATQSRQQGHPFLALPDCTIVGPQTRKVDLAMGPDHRFVSVAFHPGGLFQLVRVPLHELRDVPLPAMELLGREIGDVSEQLQAARHSLDMKRIVEAYLLRKLTRATSSALAQAARWMVSGGYAHPIDQAAAMACLSPRQFERKAHEQLGYSPKFFARLIRFSQAYRLKVNQPQASWTAISYQCGYYDQMHLIRDFKEFTASTPKQLALELQHAPLTVQDDLRI
ncbi:helix-turn-helix domain-containing protein [Hymenobacter sp. GOD-10R]|uniref:helix-turn-helix domain-containing protein n=1 Tax=Hymenobacter sp. GOD-10R TaxID=3093922 RepID=UPI002D77FF91|nr:helix-turn-helix domain-containing protein [Hymenobacter sp. GOD-10R]WRQ27118.1 helix-turn-helix domain-containing protein [Hymenobacter sp. GOD-10R]